MYQQTIGEGVVQCLVEAVETIKRRESQLDQMPNDGKAFVDADGKRCSKNKVLLSVARGFCRRRPESFAKDCKKSVKRVEGLAKAVKNGTSGPKLNNSNAQEVIACNVQTKSELHA